MRDKLHKKPLAPDTRPRCYQLNLTMNPEDHYDLDMTRLLGRIFLLGEV